MTGVQTCALPISGFSTHDASLGTWDSGFIHFVTTVFMLLGGTSFALLHRALPLRRT